MSSKIDRTAAKRQRARRERLAKAGLRQRQVFAHDDDWPEIKSLADEMMGKRLNQGSKYQISKGGKDDNR